MTGLPGLAVACASSLSSNPQFSHSAADIDSAAILNRGKAVSFVR